MRTLQQLRIITALAQHRHFGRAADELRLSQPALTKSLQAIEADLGIRLFDRGPPVTPTSLGQRVVVHAEDLVRRFAEMKREVSLARGVQSGRLVVAAGGQVAEFATIDAVAAFSRKHPFVNVDLRIGDHVSVTDDVREGRASLGIAHLAEAERHDDLACRPLRRTGYVLFCAADHPLAAGADPSPEALLDYPWMGGSGFVPALPGYDGKRRAFGDVFAEEGKVSLRLRTSGFQHTLRIVEHSQAISAAPEIILRRYVGSGRIAILRAAFGWPDLNYGIITRKGRTPAPATLAFITELEAIEAALDTAP